MLRNWIRCTGCSAGTGHCDGCTGRWGHCDGCTDSTVMGALQTGAAAIVAWDPGLGMATLVGSGMASAKDSLAC